MDRFAIWRICGLCNYHSKCILLEKQFPKINCQIRFCLKIEIFCSKRFFHNYFWYNWFYSNSFKTRWGTSTFPVFPRLANSCSFVSCGWLLFGLCMSTLSFCPTFVLHKVTWNVNHFKELSYSSYICFLSAIFISSRICYMYYSHRSFIKCLCLLYI